MRDSWAMRALDWFMMSFLGWPITVLGEHRRRIVRLLSVPVFFTWFCIASPFILLGMVILFPLVLYAAMWEEPKT